MALFDGIGKKATEVSTKALQKTKKFSEASRINTLIAEEEKKINNNYYQIGKLYFSLHMNDCEPSFSGMVEDILNSEDKIMEYRIQIQELRGVQRCEKCGAEVMKGLAYCGVCGTQVPKVVDDSMQGHIKCTHCGKVLPDDMRFCTACGKPIVTTPPVKVNIRKPEPGATQGQPNVPGRKSRVIQTPVHETVWLDHDFGQEMDPNAGNQWDQTAPVKQCVACGAPIEPGTDFCSECGTKVSGAPARQVETEKRCPSCNALLENDDVYCAECGCRV